MQARHDKPRPLAQCAVRGERAGICELISIYISLEGRQNFPWGLHPSMSTRVLALGRPAAAGGRGQIRGSEPRTHVGCAPAAISRGGPDIIQGIAPTVIRPGAAASRDRPPVGPGPAWVASVSLNCTSSTRPCQSQTCGAQRLGRAPGPRGRVPGKPPRAPAGPGRSPGRVTPAPRTTARCALRRRARASAWRLAGRRGVAGTAGWGWAPLGSSEGLSGAGLCHTARPGALRTWLGLGRGRAHAPGAATAAPRTPLAAAGRRLPSGPRRAGGRAGAAAAAPGQAPAPRPAPDRKYRSSPTPQSPPNARPQSLDRPLPPPPVAPPATGPSDAPAHPGRPSAAQGPGTGEGRAVGGLAEKMRRGITQATSHRAAGGHPHPGSAPPRPHATARRSPAPPAAGAARRQESPPRRARAARPLWEGAGRGSPRGGPARR
jgi:hypothetical protein